MVGGIIKDFFTVNTENNYSVVRFLVEGIRQESGSYTIVGAKIPIDAIKFSMVKAGQDIWWQNPHVLITIEESEDIQFEKIGFSGGNYESFYNEKNGNPSIK